MTRRFFDWSDNLYPVWLVGLAMVRFFKSHLGFGFTHIAVKSDLAILRRAYRGRFPA